MGVGSLSARQEWQQGWTLPLVSMIGVSGGAMFGYTSGIFMEPMTTAFGWSRAEFSTAFALQMICGLIVMPLVGRLTDRVGPRAMILTGMAPFAAAFALLGIVHGGIVEWWLLCLVVGICQTSISQVIWVTAIISRFDASRGLALAITLAGLGLGSLIWPLLAAIYIDHLGWRFTFGALAISWAVVAIPLVLLFFHGGERPAARPDRTVSTSGVLAAVKSFDFIGLSVAAGIFASLQYGLVVHMVPILRANGVSMTMAAGVVGVIGLASIVGRIGTGYLLDRMSIRLLGPTAFLLLILVAALLHWSAGSLPLSIAAAGLLGFASGSELDIVTYMTARRYNRAIFASVYALFMSIISLMASTGPIIAGVVFDMTGTYAFYLALVVPLSLISALLIFYVAKLADRQGREQDI